MKHLGDITKKRCLCFEPGAAKRLGGYVWEDLAPTLRTDHSLVAKGPGAICYSTNHGSFHTLAEEGNSIALPPWKWVMKRLSACYERDATLASLFDGIGGFPLIWEELNGKGSCLWASEIEKFPIAVTKMRIGEQ